MSACIPMVPIILQCLMKPPWKPCSSGEEVGVQVSVLAAGRAGRQPLPPEMMGTERSGAVRAAAAMS